jgi:hypothetical protein
LICDNLFLKSSESIIIKYNIKNILLYVILNKKNNINKKQYK